MRNNLPKRFWVEVVLASLSGFLFLLTLIWRDWIEGVFGVDPDHHNGSLEWLIVGVMLLAAISFGALARTEWRRGLPAS
jgi:hypothetical protein